MKLLSLSFVTHLLAAGGRQLNIKTDYVEQFNDHDFPEYMAVVFA